MFRLGLPEGSCITCVICFPVIEQLFIALKVLWECRSDTMFIACVSAIPKIDQCLDEAATKDFHHVLWVVVMRRMSCHARAPSIAPIS